MPTRTCMIVHARTNTHKPAPAASALQHGYSIRVAAGRAEAARRRSAAAAAPSDDGRREDDNRIANNKVVAKETAVGKRKNLFIGLNVVAALQRNECVGRSWRSVGGDG